MSGPKKWVQTRLGKSKSYGSGFANQHHQNGGCGNDTDKHSRHTAATSNSDSPPRSLGRVASYERDVSNGGGIGLDLSPGGPLTRGSSGGGGSPNTPKKSWERHYKSFLSRKGNNNGTGGNRRGGSPSSPFLSAPAAAVSENGGPPMPSLKSSVSASALMPSPLRWKTPNGGICIGGGGNGSSGSNPTLMAGGRIAGEMGGDALDRSRMPPIGLLAVSPEGSAFRVSETAGLQPRRTGGHGQGQPQQRGQQQRGHQQLLQHPSSAPAVIKPPPPFLSDEEGVENLPEPPLLAPSPGSSSPSSFGSGSSGDFLRSLKAKGRAKGGGGGSKGGAGASSAGTSADGEKAVRGGSRFKTVFKHGNNGSTSGSSSGGGNSNGSSSSSKAGGSGGGGHHLRRRSLSTDDLDKTVRKGHSRSAPTSSMVNAAAGAAATVNGRPAATTYYSHDNAGDVTVRGINAYIPGGSGGGNSGGGSYLPKSYRSPQGKAKSDGASPSPYRCRTPQPPSIAYSSSSSDNVRFGRDELDESRRKRERKMAFTEFHNSQRFGKDSTSPYLGDDPSVRHMRAYVPPSPPPAPAAAMEEAAAEETTREKETYGAAVREAAAAAGAIADEDEGGPPSLATPPQKSQLRTAESRNDADLMASETIGESSAGGIALAKDAAAMSENSSIALASSSFAAAASDLIDETTKGDHVASPKLQSPSLGGGRVLDPIPGTADGLANHDGSPGNSNDRPYLIAPAILNLCPPRVLELLSSGGGKSTGGSVVLGRAAAKRLCPELSAAATNDAWCGGRFVLHRNYLLEYSDGQYSNCSKARLPRGYAHLQDSLVHPVHQGEEHHDTTLQLDFSSVARSAGSSTVKLLIRVASREERDRWITALLRAARLTALDLYDYDDGEGARELGRGRYATIRPARYKVGKMRPARSERVVPRSRGSDENCGGARRYSRKKSNSANSSSAFFGGGGGGGGNNFSSASPAFDGEEYDCALKVVSKAEFAARVRRGHERADALAREVAVQSALVTHHHARANSAAAAPFLGLRDFFETRDEVLLELELLEGGTDLFRRISDRGGRPLEERDAARILRDLLTCLRLMADAGVAHRDVKLANVFVCDEGGDDEDGGSSVSVKLGDFGMAAFADGSGMVKGRCGTPGYVAPEIFRTGRDAGYTANKVDVFSAGVTLHVMLTGYEPFYGESEKELVAANKKGKVEFDECDWAGVSVEGRDLVEKMLHVDPDKRISAADALRHPWIRRRAPAPPPPTESGSAWGDNHASSFDGGGSCILS